MLNGVELDVALGKRGGAVGVGDILHHGLDFRLAVEIDAPESNAGIRRGRQEGQIDLVAAVQANTAEAGLTGQCLLVAHGGI